MHILVNRSKRCLKSSSSLDVQREIKRERERTKRNGKKKKDEDRRRDIRRKRDREMKIPNVTFGKTAHTQKRRNSFSY